MQEVIVSVDSDLAEPASMKTLEGTLDVPSYNVGGVELKTPHGIQYSVQLTNTGEGIVLAGSASCEAVAPCARCLEPATIFVEGDVEGYYLFAPAEELDDHEADEFECIHEDGTFDIAPAIEAALVFATPYIILCKDDCAGLCPTCGADLNKGPCSCDAEAQIDPLNPFAALKDLKFEDE